eukprot:Protomagalhaensia_wolfi_Nauph_80__1932@NODE_2211_length_1167_cov_818_861702_g1725_i0_p1_GENE_NODE_2211_length_1167_cov_818_861702_g1725_i0NODE_2211_length_1167_cov_818_861702_g1725_i0_p1_ORF_typecomplete_len157_score4_92DUF2627/PF11118_8/27DUF2627/PF11118_8/6_1_NODE_2211_length_1167_cov_818_861702_g1725_i075545
MKQGTALQKTTRWLCFIASILTFALGIVHIVDTKPRLHWPPRGFADDNNASSWRYTLFTFMPSTFVDLWTPFVLGLAGIFAHFANVSRLVGFLTHDFLTAAVSCLSLCKRVCPSVLSGDLWFIRNSGLQWGTRNHLLYILFRCLTHVLHSSLCSAR